jgi:cytochrome c-type biogenesis protein CcmH/NrfF
VLMRPAPLILLLVGTFYLWVYMRRTAPDPDEMEAGIRHQIPSQSSELV